MHIPEPLAQTSQAMHYEKSQAIFRAGDPADAVFRVMAPGPMRYDSSHINEGVCGIMAVLRLTIAGIQAKEYS